MKKVAAGLKGNKLKLNIEGGGLSTFRTVDLFMHSGSARALQRKRCIRNNTSFYCMPKDQSKKIPRRLDLFSRLAFLANSPHKIPCSPL